MGHVGSPLSLRLGWLTHWQTLWYVKEDNILLNLDTKIKILLRDFFLRKKVASTGIVYSHGIFIRKYKRTYYELFIFDPYFKRIRRKTLKKFKRKTET